MKPVRMKEFGEYVMPKASNEGQKIKLPYYGKFCFDLFLRVENQMENIRVLIFPCDKRLGEKHILGC